MKSFLVLFFCCLLISSCKTEREASIDLKIMSYNIRHGVGNDTLLDLSRSAGVIASYAPDLCALQEVDDFCERSDRVGQTDFIGQKTGLTGTFGKFMNLQGGAYGMATLSAKPVISTKVVPLPDGKYEPRTSLVQEIQLSEKYSILFVNVHFEWIGGEEGDLNRLNQAKALVAYLNTSKKAIVITGDFNCTPTSSTMQYFEEQGFVFVSKGADNLSFQGENQAEIDHIIFRNSKSTTFKTKNSKLLHEPLVSDHRPLVAEFIVIFNEN